MTQPQRRQPQPAVEPRIPFWKRAGEGLITTKFAPDTVLRSGQITLPHLGECYIDGKHGFPAFRGDDKTPMVLELRTANKERKLVAQLTMDARTFHGAVGKDRVREAMIVTLGPKAKRETWKAIVTVQHGNAGPYLRLFVPGVASKRAAGHIHGRAV